VANDRPTPRPVGVVRSERQVAFRLGISAESRAAAYLIAKGFRILARRWRSPVGEIDIIACRRQLLIFVEVKARPSFDDAAWSVTPSRTCASMPCWSRRAASRGIFRPRSRLSDQSNRVAVRCEFTYSLRLPFPEHPWP
jgi:Holliday junction resolvase-like predicted endonuclease